MEFATRARIPPLSISKGGVGGVSWYQVAWVSMQPAVLLRRINERHGTTLRLIERYAVGEQGAYAVADETGGRFVLKWGADVEEYRIAAETTKILLSQRYPAPLYVLVGALADVAYSVQQRLPGSPGAAATEPVLSRLLELNALQVGRAVSLTRDWPARVVNTVLFGGDGYCVLDTMREHSPATAELLGVLQALVRSHADADCETGDIVHYDFQPANILVEGGEVSGVVDWDATCVGDAAFDLATLLFYSYEDAEIRERLWHEVLECAGPGCASMYLAHLILRQVEWSIRHHPGMTDGYLRRSNAVLRDLRRVSRRAVG